MNYITPEQALELSVLHPDYQGMCNAAIEQYLASLVKDLVLHELPEGDRDETKCIKLDEAAFSEKAMQDYARKAVADALAKRESVALGWQLVPVEPTPEMWKAAREVPDPNPPYPPHYSLIWDAMLKAAPVVAKDEKSNLYWRLHDLSKALEDSGLIDEREMPDAYATILEAMLQAAPQLQKE